MIRAIYLKIVCAAVLIGSTDTAQAGMIYSFSGGYPQSGQPATYGFDFTPLQDITVDSLGFFDFGQDGLAASHRVGIWTTTGSLLASTTVTTANSTLLGPVQNGVGQFRFTPIAGLDLDAGTTYRFGAAIEASSDIWFYGGTNVSESPLLATVSAVGYYRYGNFIFPDQTIGNTYAAGSFTAVPNSAVPEPTSMVLLSACMTVCGVVRRRRMTRRLP